MTQSPELTGGAGFTFEGNVVATYLVSLLIEGSARGLFGGRTARVAVQQAAFGEPLDDLVVDIDAANGTRARISLQIKRSLTISAATTNDDFREIVVNSWKTLGRDGFREGVDRVGAATGDVSSSAAASVERIYEIARASANSESFAAHFASGSGTGKDLLQTVASFRTILTEHLGRPASEDEVYRLLRHFVLLRFDLLHDGAGHETDAEERLRPFLRPEDAHRSGALWNRLKTIAREALGRAADFSRNSLLEHLHGEFRLAGALSLRADIEKLVEASELALQDIGIEIDGIEVEREEIIQKTEQAIERRRFVQLIGLPGAGKSAVLRAVASKRRGAGPVVVLKSDPLAPGGWPGYAASIGLASSNVEEMLLDIASTGSPMLIIDGLDRIEIQHRGAVTDILHVILNKPALEQWRVVASLRDNGIEPLRTWVPQGLLVEGGVSTVEVAGFNDDEADRLAERVPRLRPLLFARNERVRDISRRPFFANVLARCIGTTTSSAITNPTSEIDLIEAWWRRGGYAAEGADSTRRQRMLKTLARAGAPKMGRRISMDDLDADALNELKNDGIISEVRPGHTVKFTHDIFFEWSFLHVLIAQNKEWLGGIREAGEPPVLGRVVELLSQSIFFSEEDWEEYLVQVEAAGMRPQWTRAWLVGPFSTPGFKEHAAKFTEAVLRDGARRFAKLIVWFQAEKTRANPNVLCGAVKMEEKSSFRIAQLADLVAWPSDIPLWKRFLDWLLDNIERCPTNTISGIISAFGVWQNMLADWPNPVSERIVTKGVVWLQDIEDRQHAETWSRTPSDWDALDRDEISEIEERLRGIVLRSARIMPDFVRAYLKRVHERRRLREAAFEQVILFSPTLAETHAADLVNIALAELLNNLPRQALERARSVHHFGYNFDYDWDNLSIKGNYGLHPSSPRREPFASLFKQTPLEALRLVRELCNHAMEAWRQLYELDRERRDVPIPLDLDFPWGRQTFWGDSQIYGWFRGRGSSQAIECALMALEDWAFAQAEAGRDVDEVIRDVVSGNECCAVLGIAVVLALAYNHVSAVTLPLVTAQRLWHWDIQRYRDDTSSLQENMIGFNLKAGDRAHALAVQAMNERRVRQYEIRNLAMMFVFAAEAELKTQCRTALLTFPANLPFDYESQKEDGACVAEQRRTAEIWSEIGKRENYVAMTAQDGSGTLIKLESPRSGDADVVASMQRMQEMNACCALVLWADDCFKTKDLSSRMELTEALRRAKAADCPELFKNRGRQEDIGDMLLGGVAGVAAAVLCFGGTLEENDLAWAIDVVERASETPEIQNGFWYSGSIHPNHPCVFAIRGLTGLIGRGINTAPAKQRLLEMAAHPLDQVYQEAIGAALGLWQHDESFAWIALDMGLRLSTGLRHTIRSAYGYDPQADRKRREAVIATAVNHLILGSVPVTLPKMPPAWVFIKAVEAEGGGRRNRRSEEGDWGEPDELWLWNYASVLLKQIPIEFVMADGSRREEFLSACNDMVSWTIERLAPSWQTEDRARGEYASGELIKWRGSLSSFLGKVSAYINVEEAIHRFLEPIFGLEDEACLFLLQPFVDSYICVAILDPPEIRTGAIKLLERCIERIAQDRNLVRASKRDGQLYGSDMPYLIEALFFIRHEAGGAARFANGNWQDVRLIIPAIGHLLSAAGTVPRVIQSFLTLCEGSFEYYPGDLFVRQVLGILEKQQGTPPGWRNSLIPGRIAVLIHEFAERRQPLPYSLAQDMLRILDLLVDMGDRRAAALQTSEIFKDVRSR